jgi:hypothetical protein
MSNLVGIQSIEMRPSVPSRGLWARGGAGFWREVAAAAGRNLKASGDHVNLPPSIRSVQLNAQVDLSEVTREDRPALVAALGEQLANEIRRLVEQVWRPKYESSAQEFERRLGIYALNAQPAKEASQKACNIALSYMENITDSVDQVKKELEQLLIQVTMSPNAPKHLGAGWGGGVGQDPKDLLAVFKEGNVREQISHLDLFIENVLGADILKKTGAELKKVYEACRRAKMNVHGLARRRYEVHKTLGIVTDEEGRLSGEVKKTRLIGSKPRSMAMSTATDLFKGDTTGGFKDAFTPIENTGGKGMDMIVPVWAKQLAENTALDRQVVLAKLQERAVLHGIDPTSITGTVEEQIAEIVRRLGDGKPGAIPSTAALRFKTSLDELEFEEGGVSHSAALSPRERKLLEHNKLRCPEELLPWVQGSLVNVVNEQHKWIAEARKRAMPIESAISGTTARVLNTARMFNFSAGEFPKLRLAVLGYLINIKAHSFHEIMAAAHGFPECKYVPGRDSYERVAPLSPTDLKSIAPGGKLPHEQEL